MQKLLLLLTSLAIAGMTSCIKDEQVLLPYVVGTHIDTSGPPGSIKFDFQATVNKQNLVSDTVWYMNTSEDQFTVTKFNYYISNIRLQRTDGSWFTEEESYHLIKHVDGKTDFTIKNVPEGDYIKLEFLIGVDSLRNVSGAQVGDLSDTHSMFWTWNSGYIFYKLEGRFKSNEVPEVSEFAIHVGGFEYPNSCIRSCTLSLPGSAIVKKKSETTIRIQAAVEEVFDRPQMIGLDSYYYQLPDGAPFFKKLSINYSDMFSVSGVVNKL